MPAADKSRLRDSLRQLRRVAETLATEPDRQEAGQELLDFLALLAGLKPVLLLGRGLDDPGWIEGVLSVAGARRLCVVEGPYWDATPFGGGIPPWYVERVAAALAPFRAWYVCREAAVESAVRAICAAGGRPTMGEEARLLGYPECCVAAHYARTLAFHRATLSILGRNGGGDAARMAALFSVSERLPPETPEERDGLAAVAAILPAPFGSWNMCEACARDGASPSALLSRRYAALAQAVDAGWAASLAASAAPPPCWTP